MSKISHRHFVEGTGAGLVARSVLPLTKAVAKRTITALASS
jgi:hypothetical protein